MLEGCKDWPVRAVRREEGIDLALSYYELLVLK
jgi:hypothetical protein